MGQEILTGLENICQDLPSQYSAQCAALVSAEGPAILNLVAQELPNACTALHLCSSSVANGLTGSYEGSVPLIIDVRVAHQEITCTGETIAVSGSSITFPNVGKSGDCMGDALRKQKRDPSKYFLTI